MDAFERGSTMITKIYVYIVRELILAENEGEKSAELVDKMCQITLEVFWTQIVRGEECFERTDSMLKGLGAGWTTSFLANVYPGLSRYLIREILHARIIYCSDPGTVRDVWSDVSILYRQCTYPSGRGR